MSKYIFIIFAALFLVGCNTENTTMDEAQSENPLLAEWDTPYGTPPFDKIEQQHYLPAFEKAMEWHNDEIAAIAANTESPTFANTIEAIEYSGAALDKVQNVFSGMNSAMTNDEMQGIAKKVQPLLAKHRDEINLNDALFERIKSVYEQKDGLGLNTEQLQLLDKYYKQFVRGGANLDAETKEKFKK